MNIDRVINSGRFIKEIEGLEKEIRSGDSPIIKMNFMVPDDRRSPLLFLLKPTEGSNLEADLIKYNIPGILVSLYFTDGSIVYPFAPPKIRIISPVFKRQTGRVTQGGSICMDTLYGNNWSPLCTIRSLIISASDVMSNDGINEPGRVDPHSLRRSYKYDEYEKSYGEVAGFHSFTAIN